MPTMTPRRRALCRDTQSLIAVSSLELSESLVLEAAAAELAATR